MEATIAKPSTNEKTHQSNAAQNQRKTVFVIALAILALLPTDQVSKNRKRPINKEPISETLKPCVIWVS